MTDIPELTERVASEHVVTFKVCAPIGTHLPIINVVLDGAGTVFALDRK